MLCEARGGLSFIAGLLSIQLMEQNQKSSEEQERLTDRRWKNTVANCQKFT